MTVRKLGVEEELLLVDPETRRLKQVSKRAVYAGAGSTGEGLEQELFRSQLELATSPSISLDGIDAELRKCRRQAAEAAAVAGAAVVAVATPVLPDDDAVTTAKPRYERMVDEFGESARHTIVMGMHVHVDVDGDDEAVAILDGVRPWLPVLLALSANSPFAWGVDTGYASWRSQIWGRWPTAGPTEPFGDIETYRRACEALVMSGAALDHAMMYFDARLAQSYPTVEFRIADVCTEVDDAVLLAALVRGLAETVARAWQRGEPADRWRTDLVRAATWRAARYGIGGTLVHPVEQELRPAREVVEALIAHTRDALEEAGDLELVGSLFEQLVARGSGAARQRAVAASTGGLEGVVDDLRGRTARTFADR